MIKFNNEDAFTLIEIMITIAIVTVIATAVYNAYFGSLRAWNFNKDRLEVQRVQDLTDRWISKYAKQAVFINANYSDNKTLEDGNKLYLEYKDKNENLNHIAFGRESANNDYLYFYNLDSGTKKRISDLKFTELSFNYNNDLITVNAEILNNKENNTYKFSSFFNTRLDEITTP